MLGQLERFIISSDEHEFVGRIFDLSIVNLHFDSYDAAAAYPDVKYALHVNNRTSLLVSRVESLNHVGDLLWPKNRVTLKSLPASAYDYCNMIQDVFLMRIVSVLDCCCLLAADVLELELEPRRTNPSTIRKFSSGHGCCDQLDALSNLQLDLRTERNVRFHRAEEKPLTDDDMTFKTAAIFAKLGSGIQGKDYHGRKISLRRFYNQAINGLRTKFSANSEALSKSLDDFYLSIHDEFEERWAIKRKLPTAYNDKKA